MKVTVYLPDDLGQEVQEHADLNVSAVAQKALREELHRRVTLAEVGGDMTRIEVYTEEEGDVAFFGRELAWDGRNAWAYLTRRGAIAIHDCDAECLYRYDSFDQLVHQETWQFSSSPFLAQIASALGVKYVRELDI